MNETTSEIIAFWVSVKPVCCFRQLKIVSSNKAVLRYLALRFLQKKRCRGMFKSILPYLKKKKKKPLNENN